MAERQSSRHLIAPELEAALDYLPDLDFSQGMSAFRTGWDERIRPPVPAELEVVACEERFVPGLNGAPDVRVLHYTPPGAPSGPRPAVLHFHGGGYVIGDPEINDGMNRALALEMGCVIVSVDYRLAPETAWPGALEDCYAALTWLSDNAADLGVDPARIAVAGESAGGGCAVALALHARDRIRETGSGPSICFQLLDYPMLDDRTGHTGDIHPFAGEFVWTPEHNKFGWSAMLGMEAGGAAVPEAAVPARRADLSDLPPAFVILGALDLFLEENLEYVRRLTRVGVPVELHVIPGAYHGFTLAQGSPQVALATQLRHQALGRAWRL